MWVVWVCISEFISISDFGEDMGWNGFVAFVYIAAWNEEFICLYDCVGDEFGLLVNIVG